MDETYLVLNAVDPSRNIARRYVIHMSTDLFGAFVVRHAWGRIGTMGQSRTLAFSSPAPALAFVRELLHRRSGAKRRIGIPYRLVAEGPDGAGAAFGWQMQAHG